MASGDPPASVSGYPVRTEHLAFGPFSLRLLVVDQLERYVDRDKLLRDADAAEPPYWAHLWTASRALGNYIARAGDWQGKRVIDIGCGLGLLGVIAAMKGAEVTAIDLSAEAVAMTRANADLNACRITTLQADLTRYVFEGSFDYSLAADVTYDPILQDALAVFVDRHLAADGTALCAESVRTLDAGFRRACETRGLQVTETQVGEVEENRPVVVRIAEVTRA